jgi:F0F1-type ATP synthase membrane subunit b/b'
MNEEHVKRILKADQEAQKSYELAVKNAEVIPIQAEVKAKSLLDMAKQNAEGEAKTILDRARTDLVDPAKNESVEEDLRKMELSAEKNLDKAVEFVLGQLMGLHK